MQPAAVLGIVSGVECLFAIFGSEDNAMVFFNGLRQGLVGRGVTAGVREDDIKHNGSGTVLREPIYKLRMQVARPGSSRVLLLGKIGLNIQVNDYDRRIVEALGRVEEVVTGLEPAIAQGPLGVEQREAEC